MFSVNMLTSKKKKCSCAYDELRIYFIENWRREIHQYQGMSKATRHGRELIKGDPSPTPLTKTQLRSGLQEYGSHANTYLDRRSEPNQGLRHK